MTQMRPCHAKLPSYSDRQPILRCPITGYPCEGDLSHLCESMAAPVRAGLSPRSDENF
jgi:hypothetical protein